MSASKSHLLSQVIESECVFNGDWVPASGPLQSIIEPATGERLMRCATADSAEIGRAHV